MILKNYITLKTYLCSSSATGTGARTLPDTVTDMTGTERTTLYMTNSVTTTMPNDIRLMRANLLPVVGSGSTPATIDDYALENDITSSFANMGNATTLTPGVVDGKACMIYSFIITGTNATANTLTISEVGLYKTAQYASESNMNILHVREVLNTPVTVAAGASFSIPMQWIEY